LAQATSFNLLEGIAFRFLCILGKIIACSFGVRGVSLLFLCKNSCHSENARVKLCLFQTLWDYLSDFVKGNGGRPPFGGRLVVSTPRFAEAPFAEENPDSANAKPRLRERGLQIYQE
jgi:hypothetical protein